MKKIIVLFMLSFSLTFCSKSDDDDDETTNNTNATKSGSIVYEDLARINGKLVRVVKVFNLSNKTETFFETDDFIFGGASVSKDGLIAQLFDRGRDEAIIRINKLDGTLVKQFVYAEGFTFATSGARISPDGKLVAFAQHIQLEAGKSQERVYFCGTGENNDCYYYENLGDPEWLPDGRLLAVNIFEDRTRGGLYATDAPLTVANATPTNINRIGPDALDNARDPVATPDGKTIILGMGTLQNIYAIDIASKQVKQITKDGIEQYRPAVSEDNATLFYIQKCCPTTVAADPTGSAIHAIPLNRSTTTSTPTSKNYLTYANGESVKNTSKIGYTRLTVP
jgi:hypothetical protein